MPRKYPSADNPKMFSKVKNRINDEKSNFSQNDWQALEKSFNSLSFSTSTF